MAGRRANRPPPGSEEPDAARRRFRLRRGETGRRHRRGGRDTAYERSDAAEQERVIVEALTDLREMDVREVMTPRVDVVALNIPVSAEDVARAVRESGHSAFPVVAGQLDDVVGVLYVNELFRTRRSAGGRLFGVAADSEPGEHPSAGQPGDEPVPSPIEISRRVRQAYVVPESRPVLAALVEMRRHRRGFAIVVDEYGGLAGVLSVKDLLEPIVGELHDELDVDEGPPIVRVDGSRWLVDGQTNVDEVCDRLGLDIPEGDYVTIGGYLLDGLGHIPEEGETLPVDGWDLDVQEMDKRRIASVLVRRREGAEPDEAGAETPAAPRGGSPEPAARAAPAGARAANGGRRSSPGPAESGRGRAAPPGAGGAPPGAGGAPPASPREAEDTSRGAASLE